MTEGETCLLIPTSRVAARCCWSILHLDLISTMLYVLKKSPILVGMPWPSDSTPVTLAVGWVTFRCGRVSVMSSADEGSYWPRRAWLAAERGGAGGAGRAGGWPRRRCHTPQPQPRVARRAGAGCSSATQRVNGRQGLPPAPPSDGRDRHQNGGWLYAAHTLIHSDCQWWRVGVAMWKTCVTGGSRLVINRINLFPMISLASEVALMLSKTIWNLTGPGRVQFLDCSNKLF